MKVFNYFCATKAGFNDSLNCNFLWDILGMLPKTRVGYFTKGGRGPINIKSFRVFIRTKIITINLSFKGRLTKKNL